MAGEVFIRPRAKQDIVEQAEHIAEDNPDAAGRFIDALENAFAALADMPEMGAPRDLDNPALLRVRMWPIRGFERHLVFYRPVDAGIEIIRILYATRDVEGLMNQEES